MGMDGPPPPEAPDWIVEAEEMGPPPDMGVPLAPPPKVYKRPNKREFAYTYNHVVGSWGFGRRPLPPLPVGSPARKAADVLLATRKELGECERCGLCERSSHIVYGMGNPGADLVIVGEGPGEDEDRKGLPFVGPAGQMLDRMLQGVLGLDRQKVYILNVVKCRPPRNRAPTPEEISACRPFLEAQLKAIQPKVILALGSSASKALLNSQEGIMKLRGSWHDWEGIPVRPTVHPAYLLRRPKEKRLAMEDLVALKARYDELDGLR
jgi:DNA polymerase